MSEQKPEMTPEQAVCLTHGNKEMRFNSSNVPYCGVCCDQMELEASGYAAQERERKLQSEADRLRDELETAQRENQKLTQFAREMDEHDNHVVAQLRAERDAAIKRAEHEKHLCLRAMQGQDRQKERAFKAEQKCSGLEEALADMGTAQKELIEARVQAEQERDRLQRMLLTSRLYGRAMERHEAKSYNTSQDSTRDAKEEERTKLGNALIQKRESDEAAKEQRERIPVIEELERLGRWVREATGYDRGDAIDEIARAIENRVRELRRAEPSPEGAAPTTKKIEFISEGV